MRNTTQINGNAKLVLPTPVEEGREVELMLDEYGRAEVVSNGSIVDEGNSSTANLLAGAVFPGVWLDTLEYSAIIVSVMASHASATDGLHIQWSDDGITERDHDQFTIPANTGKTFTFQPAWRYVQVEYTNGADDLTSFVLQTQLKKTPVKSSSHRIADSISGQDDAELIKSVISGADPTGIFRNAQVTVDGVLKVAEVSEGMSIAKGIVSGHSFIHKFGSAPAFDITDGFVTVWDGAEDGTVWELMQYVYSTTADIDSISSTAAGDTQDVEVQGLDTNYNTVTVSATLSGLTRVALSTNLIRVFRIINRGTVDFAGHVVVYVNSADTTPADGVPDDKTKIRAVVHQDNNQTEMAVYTIPAGYTGYLRSWYATTSGAKKDSSHTVKLLARPFGQVFQLKHKSNINVAGAGYVHHEYVEPEIFTEKTDIEMRMNTDVDASGVAGGFDIVLVQN